MAFPLIIPLILGATAFFAMSRPAKGAENSLPAEAGGPPSDDGDDANPDLHPASTHEPSSTAEVIQDRLAVHEAFVAKDWQKAVATAIASNSAGLVKETSEALRLAGKTEEAKSLLAVLRDWSALGKPASAPVKAAPARTVTPVRATAPAGTGSKPAQVIPGRDIFATKPVASPAPVKSTKPALSPAASQAVQLSRALANATRVNEPKALIKSFQATNKLVADGMYGAASARTLWNVYGILPPNPLHWPAAPRTQAGLNSYRAFLDDIAKSKPAMSGRVSAMKAALGR